LEKGLKVGLGVTEKCKLLARAALLILFASVFLLSCKSDRNDASKNNSSESSLKNELIDANKHAVKTEDEQIEDLLQRYKWDVAVSKTGLRYVIDEPGSGPKAKVGDKVILNYKVRLITGDVIYSSDKEGPMSFEIGKSDAIAGLQEGVKLLGEGGRARLIIPSHLAYGLIGDQKKIKQKATLIYSIELTQIIN
jgi:gliding motility-associated peptidyl-prolyl isomerase